METDRPLVHRIAESLIERSPPDCTLGAAFEGWRVRVQSNDPAVIDHLRRYYAPYERDPSAADSTVTVLQAPVPLVDAPFTLRQRPAGKTPKEESCDFPDGRIIHKLRTGMLFLIGDQLNLAVGDCRANSNQVVNFINSRYIERQLADDGLLLHAAAVAGPQGGLALAGFSGAGKSTLALHLLSRGRQYVSNDRLVLHGSGKQLVMHGVPKWPRINPGTILNNPDLHSLLPNDQRRTLHQLPPNRLWELERKHDVFIDKHFSGSHALSSPMKGMVILNWRHDQTAPNVEQIDLGKRRDLLPAFMKSAGLFYLRADPPADQPPGAYLQRLDGCPVYEITGGVDFHSAMETCLNVLQSTERS